MSVAYPCDCREDAATSLIRGPVHIFPCFRPFSFEFIFASASFAVWCPNSLGRGDSRTGYDAVEYGAGFSRGLKAS